MSERERRPPTVFVVDDEASVRDALRMLFRSLGMPVETFAQAQDFLARVTPESRGCLVTDLRMPVLGGIDLIVALRRAGCSLPAVVISGHGDIRLAVRAVKAGAHDFVEKPFNDQDLLDAVNAALNAPAVLAAGAGDEQRARFATLTPREMAVLRGVLLGQVNKQIARALDVSPRTVEAHRAHLMEKLQVGSLAELVALAVRAGLADESETTDPRASTAAGLRSHRSQNG